MRAGPLSETATIELLNARFENAWVLAKDVKALSKDASAPADLRKFAAALAEHYLYPVDFQIVDVTGKLYAQGEANEMRKPYREILEEGLRSKD